MTHKLALLLLGLAQQLGEGGEAGHRQLLHENAHQVLQSPPFKTTTLHITPTNPCESSIVDKLHCNNLDFLLAFLQTD